MGRPIADLSEKEKAEICELYVAGDPTTDIAEAYGLTEGTVSKVARLAGIKPRQIRSVRALENSSFDVAHLTIEDVDGEPRVLDTALGAALGYERPRDIRQLIERLDPKLRELGVLRYRAANTPDPAGRGRPTNEYLLSLPQINFLITRCGLPRADEWCVQIAQVFTAWQTGNLKAADLQTAAELQDAAEVAADAAPELNDLTEEFLRKLIKTETAHLSTKDDVNRVYMTVQTMVRRKDLKPETQIQHIDTVLTYFDGKCPCCGDRKIVSRDGVVTGNYDHATDCPGKNGAHETWLICAECNEGFRTRRLNRADYRSEFDVFQKRRKQTSRQSLIPGI